MTTAAKIIVALAESLGKSETAVEAYGLALRKGGYWRETKRGAGATPATDMDAAKLLHALLAEGPRSLPGYFIKYANLCLLPSLRPDPVQAFIREALGVPARRTEMQSAGLLDYVAGFVRLFREQRTDTLIFHSPSEPGHLEPWVYDGPQLELRIQGPFPCASLKFHLSLEAIDTLVSQGGDRERLLGQQVIPFVDELYGWAADAAANEPESVSSFEDAITALRAESAKGIRFERALGGREFDAVGAAMRGGR